MSLRIGIPQIGMRASRTPYQVMEAAATEAARRNGAALWYVGSDPDGWVYEDSTGTTPATGTDPVGLLLGRSYGASNLGAELVTNGDFSAGTGSWATFNSAGFSVSGGIATITNVNFSGILQGPASVVVGKFYRITAVRSGGTAASYRADFLGTTVTLNATTTSQVVQASSTQLTLFINSGVAGETLLIDSVSVREVLGYPALQATSGNRPTLELQANGYYGMRFPGLNDRTLVASPPLITSQVTTIWAGTLTSLATSPVVLGQNSGLRGANLAVAPDGTYQLSNFVDQANGSGVGTVSAGVPYVLSGKVAVGGAANLYKNGVSISAVNNITNAFASTNVYLGTIGGTNPLSGVAVLACIANTVMPDADRIAIERFAALLSGASYT